MASSLWGGLAGLGDAMVGIGQDMTKRAFADKLEKEREARADIRQKEKEQREEYRKDQIVASTDYVDRDGALFKRTFNAKGKPLDEVLASKDEIDKRNRDQIKFDQESQANDLAIEKAMADLADRPEDKSIERRLKEAQIKATESLGAQRDASAAYSDYRAAGGSGSSRGLDGKLTAGQSNSTSALTEGFLSSDTGKALREQYDMLTADEFLSIVNGAIIESKERGIDAGARIRSALRGKAAQKAQTSKK